MKETLTVIPAHGRDYHSGKAAAEAWLAEKDFQIQDISSRYNGRYCSCRDPIIPRIRYDKLRKAVTVYDEQDT